MYMQPLLRGAERNREITRDAFPISSSPSLPPSHTAPPCRRRAADAVRRPHPQFLHPRFGRAGRRSRDPEVASPVHLGRLPALPPLRAGGEDAPRRRLTGEAGRGRGRERARQGKMGGKRIAGMRQSERRDRRTDGFRRREREEKGGPRGCREIDSEKADNRKIDGSGAR